MSDSMPAGARRSEAPVPPPSMSTPLGQSSLGDRDQARAAGAGRDLDLPADVASDLVAGRLSQRCPHCGTTEAAGGHCTACFVVTGPDDWFRPAVSEAKVAALVAARAKRRETANRGAALEKSAPPEPLA